ncbi:MAG TPA: phospholipase C, phosphocholine-specific [Streptosporangiaceae bacterium]|nr:phospholipase C, phosphocholine-specific [Streptosporangiaceae bacterium]
MSDTTGPGTDYRTPAPFAEAVSRRRFLSLGGTAAGVAITAGAGAGAGLGGLARAPRALAASKPHRLTGTIRDLKHVVILMQENRSFDHYFGSLQGVRGFADKQVLKYQNGTNIFQQPDAKRTDLGYLLPFHMDSTKVNAQNAGDLDHSWTGDHNSRAGGLWNNYVPAKSEQTMGYFTRADIPFQYAVADAFTICDGYYQGIMGPTSPNRMYFWTGTSGGVITNPADYAAVFKGANALTTYPELLQKAGITWQVYTNREVGDGGGINAWIGDFGDNPLWFYQQYEDSMNSTTAAGQELAMRGAVQPWQPNAGTPLGPNHVNHVLAQFVADATAGTLPQVTWIVAPNNYTEHPAASPSYGAHYVRTVLEALMGNQELWNSTALFLTYDEHDGYFDHMVPPAPEASVTNEFIGGLPIGFGNRVPMVICSPWTRGGFVDSNTYNHTSVLQFLETWTGVRALNITDWRRSISGDLTAAFDFSCPDFSIPNLPDTVPLITQSDAEKAFPKVAAPPQGQQTFPVQEAGTRPHRPSLSEPHADARVNRSTGLVTATLAVRGKLGVSLAVYPDALLPQTATQFTVTHAGARTYTWDTTKTGGKYAFSVYGPDGFLVSFAGTVVPAGHAAKVPDVRAQLRRGHPAVVRLTLENNGKQQVTFTLTPNDYSGQPQTIAVGPGHKQATDWPANADGYYDVSVTADSGDGFLRRYAGRVS